MEDTFDNWLNKNLTVKIQANCICILTPFTPADLTDTFAKSVDSDETALLIGIDTVCNSVLDLC